ncbi:hypothetical protein [Pseudokineococcus lusitanus]|uniref:Uncharacterized protein n=1 Tax=Pseudokineococcus lusitanus TaxID=763993 RepID=A0A3N1HTT5_9ACTN|nr:hypothetical protein [Pseudokineococcus lusitanus]ROP45943.1 hypothetical protein EDC03_0559 [Pseudokineococcus lusitanus]
MAATDGGGQRLKGTLAARHPRTDELSTFPPGTPREELPSWVQVDDGAFDGEPAPAPAPRRRRRAAAAASPPESEAGGQDDVGDADDVDDPEGHDGSEGDDDGQDPAVEVSSEDGQEPPSEPATTDEAPPAKATRKKR